MKYNFPKTKFVDENNFEKQFRHILSEVEEIKQEILKKPYLKKEVFYEIMDLYHAIETLFRKYPESSERAYKYVIRKNRNRGYYVDDVKNEATDKEPMPEGKGKIVVNSVVKDLLDRSEIGEKKYGTVLRTNNGREPLVDMYQEMLDGVMYLKQHLMENK